MTSTTTSTKDRILDAALHAFGTNGYDATSLDDLADELGIAKQTILYHYPSKEILLDAVIDRSADEVIQRIERALATAGDGFERIEAIVRAVFRLAARRPAMLGLFREVSRLGPPAATRLTGALDELMQRAEQFLDAEMDAGHMKRHDPRLLMLSGYSMVIGLATEVEVLRALGEEPTLASLVRRRNELISFLRSALIAP
ncbi:MAG TPA: TetR/AcrR family transcriptional regulator [Acidimicrobiales bacterium]|nr:TetR/AcrR family transcriptional regulator [Acidimicrobiales bacterium]